MTGSADASSAVPGVAVAGMVIGSTEAQPLSIGAQAGKTAGLTEPRLANTVADAAPPDMEACTDAERVILQRAIAVKRMLNGHSAGLTPAKAASSRAKGTAAQVYPADPASKLDSADVISARRLVDEMPQDEVFALIREARMAATELGQGPSASSQKDYMRKVNVLRRACSSDQNMPEERRWQHAILKYAGRRESFKAYRAALCWHLRGELRVCLKAQDRLQRAGDRGQAWRAAVAELHRSFNIYEAVHGCSRQDAPATCKRPAAGTSKRHALKKIAGKYPEWREVILAGAAGSDYEDAILLMSMVGCRPEEIATGVVVSVDEEGRIRARIDGAKVTKNAGQPWRSIPIDRLKLPDCWAAAIEAEGCHHIKLTSKDGLRNYLQRLSAKNLRGVPAVTAYVFRHALASELRKEGASAEEIASVLGHCGSDTQRAYGTRGGRSSGKQRPATTALEVAAVKVAREVRPLDRSGLAVVLGKRVSFKSTLA